jgi:hypothetical protein
MVPLVRLIQTMLFADNFTCFDSATVNDIRSAKLNKEGALVTDFMWLIPSTDTVGLWHWQLSSP